MLRMHCNFVIDIAITPNHISIAVIISHIVSFFLKQQLCKEKNCSKMERSIRIKVKSALELEPWTTLHILLVVCTG